MVPVTDHGTRRSLIAIAALSVACASGCTRPQEATTTYYDRKIGPILISSCTTSPSQSTCHVNADREGNALGNLDVSSYNDLILRHDLLLNYGPYGIPELLLKVVKSYPIQLTSYDGQLEVINTDVAHQGGQLIDETSSAFTTLNAWIANGASVNNSPPPPPKLAFSTCSQDVGTDPDFDPTKDPASADYQYFLKNVDPVLGQSCAATNCHGTPVNTLYLTCGQTAEQSRWNYFAASQYVSKDVNSSEILRRALAPDQGGVYHEGGTIFTSPTDPRYEALTKWVQMKGSPSDVPTAAGFQFFATRVQPMLVKRGCMQMGCHSPAMGHEYRLRGGSGGHFSLAATKANYLLTLEQVALDSPDPNSSRIIRKNLLPDDGGILHRGGPLFSGGGDPTACDTNAIAAIPLDQLDQQLATLYPNPGAGEYCVLVTWIAKERQDRMGTAKPLSDIVFVERAPAPGPDTPQDYGTYAPGADLMMVPASLDANNQVQITGSPTSLLAECGLDPATADVRRPAVSWDGTQIAFAARSSASEPLKIYIIDGNKCAPDPVINAPAVDESGKAVPTNGELVHNFDPTFAPDGRIVFASTRGNIMDTSAFDYQGPQRTPADPSKLNADLYVEENGKIRQLTFLLNQELSPFFMNDGRLIMTTEKRAPGFYQLAGRRMNLDGGDYHPLFGQRGTVGYNQLTNIVELDDKDFAGIFSDEGAEHQAGTLAIINRSLGIDMDTNAAKSAYVQDPGAETYIDQAFYQHSITILDPAATGRATGATQGAYRDPAPLPNDDVLVSYAPNVTNLASFSGNFDIYDVDPHTGKKTQLITNAKDLLWPTAVYARYNPHGIFQSKLAEPNGATHVSTDSADQAHSEITFLDVPLLGSLIFQNTRTGRILPKSPQPVDVWEDMPPPQGVTSYAQGGSYVTKDQYGQLYVRRRLLGKMHVYDDGSARVQIPGGMPIVLSFNIKLAGDSGPALHYQREEMQFYPGESVRQSFPRKLFDGECGLCHGSVSGLESHVALNPDILTQASNVAARTAAPTLLMTPGSDKGPPFP
jgi:WD40-like Beta Propeller Repeat